MSHAGQGHSRPMGHSGKFWQNMTHWRRTWQPTPVLLPRQPHEQYEKQKRFSTRKWAPQVRRCPVYYWERAEAVTNSSRKNEAARPERKQHAVVDVSGGESKVWCCKEQYCIETWIVRSMNQDRLNTVKQEMARVNTDILGITELKCTGMGEFNSDDHYIYYCGQESCRRNGVALTMNKRVWNAVLGCSLKNDRMLLACFQGKPFNAMQCKQ